MKFVYRVCLVVMVLAVQRVHGASSATASETWLLDAQQPYVVSIAHRPDAVTLLAAKTCASTLSTMLKRRVTIQKCSLADKNAVLLSVAPFPAALVQDAVLPRPLARDTVYTTITTNGVCITAPTGLLTFYGVCDFLQNALGCRWYTPEVSKIPTVSRLRLPVQRTSYASPFTWREVYYYEACDPLFCARMKLNGNASVYGKRSADGDRLQERHGGWGIWCHSVFDLMGAHTFKRAPERYALVKNQRSNTQVCMSDPETIRILTDNLKRAFQRPVKPRSPFEMPPRYWSVSQMDGHGYCTCERCKALDAADGGPIGSILYAINQIAKACPEHEIGTLSYDYSRRPPTQTTLATNVVIQLCSIEAPRIAAEAPLATAPQHAAFRNDIVTWGMLCHTITVWDYVIQFQNLVAPFPNWDVLQPNLKFFAQHHVSGYFAQGNRERGGEFAELRTYLLAQLLWNPEIDALACRNDFLKGYYEEAAPHLAAYIQLQLSELQASGKHLSIDGEPAAHKEGFLSQANVARYTAFFDAAEKSVAHKPNVLKRVQKERLAVDYVRLRLNYDSPAEREKVLARFLKTAREHRVWMLSEVTWRQDQMGTLPMFEKRMKEQRP